MTPDELWEKYHSRLPGGTEFVRKHAFLAALKEYGESVRQQAVRVCEKYAKESSNPMNFSENCAADIKTMELP